MTPRPRIFACHALVAATLALSAAIPACSFPAVTIAPAECQAPSDCPQSESPCERASCRDGSCGFTSLALGEACGVELVCDAAGACVACIGADDCGDDACVRGVCAPPHCANTQHDDTVESDVDCGGLCPPCALDASCDFAGDCESGVCAAGSCSTCQEDLHCAQSPGTYCDAVAATCLPDKDLGVTCSRDNECQAGSCPEGDFVCCDSACDGTCRSCRQAYTDEPNGICADVKVGLKPDGECPVFGCNGSGLCL
jgi:hypothetical protein